MNLQVNQLTPIKLAFFKRIGSRGRIRVFFSLFLLVILIRVSAVAQWSGQNMSADQAAQRVQQATGGQVLGVQVPKQFNATVYRVRVLLPDGRVREWQVDAQTGQILNR